MTAQHASSQSGSRDALLKAARTVFAKKGYDGATVKELAEEAGVNISLVSYHFGGKEGLYRACLETSGQTRLASAERILRGPESLEDFRIRLKLFIEEFIEFHLQEPDLCTILHHETASTMELTHDIFFSTFIKVFETLVKFVKTAQKQEILSAEIDPYIASGLFYGGLIQAVRSDRIQEQLHGVSLSNKNHREKVITQALRSFIEGNLRRST